MRLGTLRLVQFKTLLVDSTRPKTGPLSWSQGAWITGELRAVRILLTDRDEAWQLVRVLTLVVRIPDFVVQVH